MRQISRSTSCALREAQNKAGRGADKCADEEAAETHSEERADADEYLHGCGNGDAMRCYGIYLL